MRADLLQAIAVVELARRGWVESIAVSDRNWAVLVQQLLAMTLQATAISPENIWAQLGTIPDFKGIEKAEFDRLIKHMLKNNYLYLTEGLLAIGSESEKAFERKNFMDLSAIFSSPQQYEVYTG